MPTAVTGLSTIATKPPIVSTFAADALRQAPAAVGAAYTEHAATYVEQPPLLELRRRFVAAVLDAKTPKACLVAPFGYGKTASAIGIWQACREAKLLALPPVSCGSFTDIARAIYDWCLYALPEQRGSLDLAHDRFLAGSAEALARRDEYQFGIPFEQGLAAITDKLRRGYLDFEDISVNLLAFLEHVAGLALESGYRGLVIAIDELQQLLGNAGKGVLVALRQFIWGLRTRQLPLGLLLTMDVDTERTLADRAGDILHRIKDDGLYLNLQHIYDRGFPARLWGQYAAAFALPDHARAAIDRPTLDALGQLCERDDLSSGPRIVIRVFQLAAGRRQTERAAGYSPVDLIDDFIQGSVRFDGDRALLPAIVTEFLNLPYFQRAPDRARALKLIAAFPRGCPEQVAISYGLVDAYRQLGDELRGEILTELDEGLALIELQRVGRPANRLNTLLRRFWMQISDQQIFAEDAPRRFAELIVPLLFPSRIHDLAGWARLRDVQLDADGSYAGLLEGTSSPRYPLRRLAVVIVAGSAPARFPAEARDADFRITFRLNLDGETRSHVNVTQQSDVEFILPLHRVAAQGLGGLSWIEHYLSPQPISPAVVLGLLWYLSTEGRDGGSSRDRARLEDTAARLRQWLLAELLSPGVFQAAGYEVVQGGADGLREFLHLLAAGRWPDYQTLVVHQHWVALFSDYCQALDRVPPPVRTGVAPADGTKADVAALFGQARHAGFESRARDYGNLLRLEAWKGDSASIRLVPHPLELRLAHTARGAGLLGVADAYGQARALGFSSAEARLILELATKRGLLDRRGGEFIAPAMPSAAELMVRLLGLEARYGSLSAGPATLEAEMASLRGELEDGGETAETGWRLDRVEAFLSRAEDEALAADAARYEHVRSRVLSLLPSLHSLPSGRGTNDLAAHLGALRQRLDTERQQLRKQLEMLLANRGGDSHVDADAVLERASVWRGDTELLARWQSLAERIAVLQNALTWLGADGAVLGTIQADVDGIIRSARAVLAEAGISGLSDVAQLEVSLAAIEGRFQLAGDERSAAHEHAATRLCEQVRELVGRPISLLPLPYDPSDDPGSACHLREAVAAIVSKALVLLLLEVTEASGSKEDKLRVAKLVADIRALARRASDPDWLIQKSSPRLQDEAMRSILAIRSRVSRQLSVVGSDLPEAIRSLIARMLMSSPLDLFSFRDIVERLSTRATPATILSELLSLEQLGAIDIKVELRKE